MISYAIQFLPKHRLSSWGIIYHRHIFTMNVTWAFNRYSYHIKFVPKALKLFHSVIHGKKIGSEHGWFHSRLFLWKKVNQIQIHRDRKTVSIAPGGLFSWVVTVDHRPLVFTITKWRRSVGMYPLLNITIEGRPLFLSLEVLINHLHIGQVKGQARVVFPFQVKHNTQIS